MAWNDRLGAHHPAAALDPVAGRRGLSRRTNLGLLGALAGALLTGLLAFALGTPAGSAVVIAHGVAGLAVVALSPAKQAIIRRGLRRPRRGRYPALVLLVAVVVTLVTGVAHAAGLVRLPLGVTTMQVHVGAGLTVAVLATWHAVSRPGRPRRADLSRRTATRAAGIAVASAAGWLAIDGLSRLAGFPGAGRRFTGSHERGSGQPAAMPVTQWLTDSVPRVDDSWALRCRGPGLDDRFDLERLRHAPMVRAPATLDCTGGWYASQSWTGVPLSWLLAGSGAGSRILVRSVTGYSRAFPPEDLDNLLLALAVADLPLSAGHGFPARLVAPGRRGFWWVKWVEEIVVDDDPWWRQPPFPLQ